MRRRDNPPVTPDGREYTWERDGWVPPGWDAGLVRFQRANGLLADGLYGPKTQRAGG